MTGVPRTRVPSALVDDPVVATALSAHGHAPHTVEWHDLGNGPEAGFPAEGGRPNIHIDGGYAYVRWWRPEGRTVTYEVTDGDPRRISLRIPDLDMPDTLRTSLPGRRLSDVVRIAGDPGLFVVEAHVEHLGEYRHTVLTLAKP